MNRCVRCNVTFLHEEAKVRSFLKLKTLSNFFYFVFKLYWIPAAACPREGGGGDDPPSLKQWRAVKNNQKF